MIAAPKANDPVWYLLKRSCFLASLSLRGDVRGGGDGDGGRDAFPASRLVDGAWCLDKST